MNVGDVYVVRTGGWAGRLIRLGAALRDQPGLDNHVAVFHHFDAAGVPWGIEGRPGGVGWTDLRRYLRSRYTLSNEDQPKTDAARQQIADGLAAMLGASYDWIAIAGDAFAALHIKDLFAQDWKHQGTPGHVVCSSLAAYLYDKVSLIAPPWDSARDTTPGDWAQFCIERDWEPKR